jgi:hypothetical protein
MPQPTMREGKREARQDGVRAAVEASALKLRRHAARSHGRRPTPAHCQKRGQKRLRLSLRRDGRRFYLADPDTGRDGHVRTTLPSTKSMMAVFVAAANASARFRARSNAGSVRANSGFLASSMGFGFIASHPNLAGLPFDNQAPCPTGSSRSSTLSDAGFLGSLAHVCLTAASAGNRAHENRARKKGAICRVGT